MRRIAAMLLSVALWSCSGIPVQRDYNASADFSSLKTFSWKSPQRVDGDNLADNALMESRVRKAAEAALIARGYRRTEGVDADFRVTYHYLVDKEEARDRVRSGVGFGMGSGGSFGGVSLGVGSGRESRERATLAIDLLDPSGALIWHGFTRRELVRRSDPAKTEADVSAQVNAILSKFPPEKKKR